MRFLKTLITLSTLLVAQAGFPYQDSLERESGPEIPPIEFEATSLDKVTRSILTRLDYSYSFDNPLDGKVTLKISHGVPDQRLLQILDSLLQANGYSMAKIGDDHIRIEPATKSALLLRPALRRGRLPEQGLNVVVLDHISVAEMKTILSPHIEPPGKIIFDEKSNTLILSGSEEQVKGWNGIIDIFDQKAMEGRSVGYFPLNHTSATASKGALEELLQNVFAGEGSDSPPNSLYKIMEFETRNSLLVVAVKESTLDTISSLIGRIDTPLALSGENQLHLYKVENSNAARMADLLNNTVVHPSGEHGAQSLRIVADDTLNALLIHAPDSTFERLIPTLKELDKAPSRVMISASIIEVDLTGDLRYGLEWTFENGLPDNFTGTGSLSNSGQQFAQSAGFSYASINTAGEIKALFTALESRDVINMHHSLSVAALDNGKAELKIGDEIPVLDKLIETDNENRIRSYKYQDTGLKLTVTPSITTQGIVRLSIEQSVTDIGDFVYVDEAEELGAYVLLERQIVSEVLVRSNESIVLGGLIKHNKSTSGGGIPLLHGIPVVGTLFGNRNRSSRRTELLVILSPKTVEDNSLLQQYSEEMKKRITKAAFRAL